MKKTNKNGALTLGSLLITLFILAGCSQLPRHTVSDHYDGERFFNVPAEPTSQSTWKIWWYFLTAERVATVPQQSLPVKTLDWAHWEALSSDTVHVARLGHSSLLLKLHGQQWLTDPVFSERASPFSFAGPKRFHKVPIDLDNLPMLDGVIISHDHFDHLDADTIRRIHPKVRRFVTTLGVGARLQEMGVPAEKITELDWQHSVTIGHVELTAQPAQHFSGRSLFDRNRTLWAAWVLRSKHGDQQRSLYFSADSGYFPGFAQTGKRFGPFDLTMIENGAWDSNWPGVHMTPEESLQAHQDLGGGVMMPIHNGTFDLALHSWDAPMERITALAEQRGVTLATPLMGEVLSLGQPVPQQRWWRGMR